MLPEVAAPSEAEHETWGHSFSYNVETYLNGRLISSYPEQFSTGFQAFITILSAAGVSALLTGVASWLRWLRRK